MEINFNDNVVKPDQPIVPQLGNRIETDAVIIGGGPNGLITGAYLAKAGLKVVVAEKRYEIGGGLATEEIMFPLYYANTHATYHLMVDYMPVLRDFNLAKHGLQWIKPSAQTGMIFTDGEACSLSKSILDSTDALSRMSLKDAQAFEKLSRLFKEIVSQILAPATYWPPIPPGEFAANLNRTMIGQELMRMSDMKPVEIIDQYFSDKRVKAIMLYMIGMWGVDLNEDGMGFMVPLLINRGLQKCLCYGGSHKFASALAREIITNNGLVLENAEVKRIIMEDTTVKGVELFDGTQILAKVVVSSLDPNTTFLKLVGESYMDSELANMAKNWKWDKWSFFTLHVALNNKPAYKAIDRSVNSNFINIIGFDSDQDVVTFFDTVQQGDIQKIGGHITCETNYDPTLSRMPDKHIAFFQMPAPYALKGGWEARKKDVADRVIQLWSSYAANINTDNIIVSVSETPLDIERRLASMVHGSIKHGDYTPLQMGYFRPNDLTSSSRTPINKLYLCGASMYPGGLIIGGPGYIAANIIAEDMEVRRWWTVPNYIKQYIETYL